MALVISKNTDTNFVAPLGMHFQRSEGTLDSLKVFSVHEGGNRRWVPLIISAYTVLFSKLNTRVASSIS